MYSLKKIKKYMNKWRFTPCFMCEKLTFKNIDLFSWINIFIVFAIRIPRVPFTNLMKQLKNTG